MRELFFLFLVLACPIAMFLMMRGGHGHAATATRGRHSAATNSDRAPRS
jgi:hypothetical protein